MSNPTGGRVFAIDPGPTLTGWCLIDIVTRRPLMFGKTLNEEVLGVIYRQNTTLPIGFTFTDIEAPTPSAFDLPDVGAPVEYTIEQVASYGMPVGAEVFDTCIWVGRFFEAIRLVTNDEARPVLVKRHTIKLHHCHSPRANDATIRQALVDRFAPGAPNFGKGTKELPSWFHGFKADIWQAYALAVYRADMLTTYHHRNEDDTRD